MAHKAYLILENKAVFEGESFGAKKEVAGEIVFTTGMTGYLETLTDQSYHGQIVLQTFPLIGNYGIIPADFESESVGPLAYIVKHPCQDPSNFRSEGDLDTFLRKKGIAGLCNIDTRALAKMIRESGVMNGKITLSAPTEADFEEISRYAIKNAVEAVSIKEPRLYKSQAGSYQVALFDYGLKSGIRRALLARGCDVIELPCGADRGDILKLAPDGIMLSNGPGDPAENTQIIENLKEIITLGIPVFGICLGHQLLALAHGFKTHKLKYGHRGANQPVKDLVTGRVYITSQNHGYAVSLDSIDENKAQKWFVNVNDASCEGILYKDADIFSVQFHPEASAGPRDTEFLFDRFIKRMGVK